MTVDPRPAPGRPPHRRGRRAVDMVLGAAVVLSAALAMAGCAGATRAAAPGGGPPGPAASTATTHASTTVPATTAPSTSTSTTSPLPAVTVTDVGGRKFVVRASSLPAPLALLIQGWLRSASPGHVFLQERLTVTNPTGAPESLQEFDDPTTGLALGVEFVMGASDASQSGYGADCGAAPGYPAPLCPISFPQGVVVDSDSATTGGPAVTLGPGASAQIVYSFGPVPSSLGRAPISFYFSPATSGPVQLGV